METKLIDYHWNGTSYVNSGTFTFSPGPSSVGKTSKVEWRVRHTGKKELKKCRWRYRRTEELTLEGIVSTEADRLTLEAFSTRNSKFVLDLANFQSPVSEGLDYGSTIPASAVTSYYIITDFSCKQVPGQLNYQYSLKLERTEGI